MSILLDEELRGNFLFNETDSTDRLLEILPDALIRVVFLMVNYSFETNMDQPITISLTSYNPPIICLKDATLDVPKQSEYFPELAFLTNDWKRTHRIWKEHVSELLSLIDGELSIEERLNDSLTYIHFPALEEASLD